MKKIERFRIQTWLLRCDEQDIVSENVALHCVSFLLMPSCLRGEIAKYCKGQAT